MTNFFIGFILGLAVWGTKVLIASIQPKKGGKTSGGGDGKNTYQQ